MSRKEILIICLIMCFILSLQAVAAADVDNNDTGLLKTQEVTSVSAYSLPNSQDTLLSGSGNAGTFLDLQGNLTGDDVTLESNYTWDSNTDGALTGGIVINHNMTITGNGIVIDANHKARVFNIAKGATVTLRGITFINGNATGAGGSIFGAGTVHIDNCKFINNTANKANGGAICLSGYGSTINNSYFEGNKAIKNPNNLNSGGAGAVFLNASNITINHSTFIKNWAGLNGGAVGSSGTGITNCTITNCTFTSNTANGSAGAVGMQSSNFKLSNSTFKYNEAKGLFDTYPGNGGALVMRGWDSYAYNCTFINNTAKQHGGASFLTNTTYNPINNNTGFILCTFINNTAGVNGGAVTWAKGATHAYVEDSIFTNNTAKRSGGAVYCYGTDGDIRNSTFTNNTALGLVSAPDSYGSSNYGGYGGAIMWVGANGTVDNCTFKYNEAKYNSDQNQGGRGGAVYLQGSTEGNCTNTTFSNCIFIGNIAGTNGGAVDWHKDAHDGQIINSTFENNIANSNGGAVYWRGHHGDIINCNFTNNTAKGLHAGTYGNIGDGGAVFWAGINGTVENSRFIDNIAARNGGAVYLENCSHGNRNTTFHYSYFKNNTAGYNGGAIYYHENAVEGKLSYCEFIDNTAKRSAGAVFWIGTNGTIEHTNFTNNRALGGVLGATAHTAGLSTTGGSGGAIIWAGSNGNVTDCRFVNNTAAKRGGAIFLEATQGEICTNVTIIDSLFENNIAEGNGGAVAWDEGAQNGLMENCTFINNTARRNGGAIFWNGYNGTIKNSRFDNNRATGENREYNITLDMGDTIEVVDEKTLRLGNIIVIKDDHLLHDTPTSEDKDNLFVLNYTKDGWYVFESYVADNSTGTLKWLQLDNTKVNTTAISPVDWAIDQYFGGDGGTLLWSGDIGLVYNCTFINSNSARRGGGAYMTGSDNVTYNYCNFTNCTSGTNGGGVDWLAGANYGKIYNCIFNGTRAARSAGAIYYDGWYGEMINITILNTKSWGGSLKQSDDGRVTYAGWDSSHWDTNTTGGDAGAIMFTGNHEYLYNVTFTNCTATGRGGAVFLQDNSNVTFDTCKFEHNTALGTANNTFVNDKDISSGNNTWLTGYGGAVAFDVGASNGTFKNSQFISNYAVRLGGAISFGKGSSNATVFNCSFENNTAARNGGAISWDGANGNMSYSNFTNNRALGTDIDRSIVDITSLSQIVPRYALPDRGDEDKMYILVKYNETTKKNDTYTMYVYKGAWIVLEVTNETGPSPIDWATDEYFGGDGGSIYWRGDNGIVDHCNFTGSNSARRGGGAYMTGSDNITFQNSYFFNCTSGTNGGGLDWLAGANYGKVINCTFEDTCAVRSAGAIYYDGDKGEFRNIVVKNTHTHGGELDSKDNVVNYAGWDASHWDTNTTGGDGGAFMFTGDHIYVYNATFINCTAAGRGGAVFLQDNNNVTFELCRFENNIALGTANNTYNDARNTSSGLNKWYTGNGGAISFDKGASNGTILSSTFINNTAARNGGAVSFSVNSTDAYIYNSSFINNTAKRNGGAMEWDGTNGNVSYCNFTGNKALGTAISTEYANITSLSQIINETGLVKPSERASIYTDNKLYVLEVYDGDEKVRYELFVSQISLEDNRHYWLKIDETTETGPSAIDWATDEYFGGDGGSIYWGGDNATIDNCIFIDSNSARRGGGAYMTGGDHVSYINCSFENCTSGTNGGGLDWLAGANYGKVIDCNFTNTQAARSAGAIYYDGDYGEFRNVIIKNTTAHGGEINQSEDGAVKYARWDASHWDTNTTGGDGGAIMFTGDHIKLYNVNVTDCTATGRGGAVFLQANHNVTFELCRFENNRALGTANNTFNDPYDTSSGLNKELTGHGGAIAFDMGATSNSIINSTFINNTVSGEEHHGGAVYFRQGASEDKIINSTFTLNHADEDGGAIFLEGEICELHNSTFTSNYAGDDGGAIFWKGNLGTIYNITCTNNSGISLHGNSKGGTICLNGNNISLSNSSFKQSYAKVTGGALFVTGDYVNITGCEFEDCNVTTETGGAIQIVGNHVEVRNSTFEECHAPNGGAIYAQGQYVKIIDSNFTNNNVTKDGAALYVNGDHSELHNSTFKNNTAGDDGGAIYWNGNYGTIYNITCENNKGINMGDSNSNGGTICITGHDITLSESTFKNSSAGAQGGAIFVTGDNVNIMGSEFESCNATEEGGAIYVLGDYTTISSCTIEDCNATQGGAIFVEGNHATISVGINNTHALGADSYCIVIDYKFYKDNVKEIKYDINDTIKYVLNITVDDTFTNDTLADLNATLKNLYVAVDNILTADGINTTNVTKALTIVTQLNATLTQLNATLSPGTDKNITLALLSDIQNIGNGLNYLMDISETPDIPGNVTVEIGTLIGEVRGITTGGITSANKTYLISTLNGIKSDVEKILDGNTFNATNIEHALELLNDLNETLKELNATLTGNDKKNVIKWLGEVKVIENQLNNLSDLVVVPEVVARGGAIYVEGNDTTIYDSSINRTDAYEGGAVYVAGDNVIIDNTEFNDNNATEDGGALFVDGNNGKLYNSNFTRNTVGDDGGAVSWKGDYGTVYNIICVSNNGTGNGINGNHSTKGGAIIITGNYATLSKSTFNDSYAGVGGGAIFISGHDVNITDSVFTHSRAGTKDGTGIGGAIYILGEYCLIDNCTIEDANATQYGGAIYIEGNYTTVAANFKNANATLSGGAIFVDGHDATITNSTFGTTRAFGSEGNGGGAIFVEGVNTTISYSNFTNTHADSNSHARGGAIYITGENATVIESKFNKSYSNLYGGAIYVNGTNTIINGSDFDTCTVDSTGCKGGAVYIDGLNTQVTGSNFTNCEAKAAVGGFGGAIFIQGDGANITYSNFTLNKAYKGGGIYIDGDHSLIDMDSFANNSVSSYGNNYGEGGAVVSHGNYTKLSNSNFTYNHAGSGPSSGRNYAIGRGGAVTWYGTTKEDTIEGCYFEGNYAQHGGAIRWEQITGVTSNGLINTSTFINNHGEKGGTISWAASASGKLDNCTFIGNRATKNAAGIYLQEKGSGFNITNTRFINESAGYGPGDIASKFTNLKVINCNFTNSTAGYGGAIGLHENTGAVATIIDCNFINTSATGSQDPITSGQKDYRNGGGAIYVEKGRINLYNSTFENCSSASDGGAIYIISSSGTVSVIENATISDSKANGTWTLRGPSGNGGAIYLSKGATIINVTISDSSAIKGGAIYKYGNNTVTISKSNIINNTAQLGGGVYVDGRSLTIQGSNLTLNKANTGSAIYAAESFTLTNTKLIKNRADTSTLSDINKTSDTIDIYLEGNDNLLNAIYIKDGKTVTCTNVDYWKDGDLSTGVVGTIGSKTTLDDSYKSNREKGIDFFAPETSLNTNALASHNCPS